MVDLPSESRLALDWELWVVEHLLFTGKRDDLVRVLVEQGVPFEDAKQQVKTIEESPGFARLRARVGEGRLARQLQSLQAKLAPDRSVRKYDTISKEDLLRDHWMASRPALLPEVARSLRAVQTWSMTTLARRFTNATVEVNVKRLEAERSADVEKVSQTMPFPEYVALCQSQETDAYYIVSRNGLLNRPEFRSLWDDFTPLPDFLTPLEPPLGVSLWMGPAGTRTRAHFDPHNVLLVQVEGRKQVRLAPRLAAHQHDLVDGYYLKGEIQAVFGSAVQTVILEAGQALFMPVGWFHEITAVDPSITLSFLNFEWPNHFHWLGPPGSDDPR